jgi:heterodisulfide reductase subunit D
MFLSDIERKETITACRHCMMCHIADRVASLVRRESYTPRGRGAILFAIERGLLEFDETVADIMYTTQNDGLLMQWCVGNYDHEELVIDTRAKLFERGLSPVAVSNHINTVHNNQKKGFNSRKVLLNSGVKLKEGAELLLYCGYSQEPSPSELNSLIAMGRLLNEAQIAFQALENEPDCGWSLYQLGDWKGATIFSSQTSETFKKTGAERVLTIDADCYRMLSTRNNRFGGDLKGITIVHAIALIANLIEEGTLKPQKSINKTITYHDPCALSRYCDDTESPRKIIAALFQNQLKEIETSGKWTNCCGAGGMLQVHRPDIANKVAVLRIDEAIETGADILATGCSRCVSMFSSVENTIQDKGMEIVNLIDLVAESVGLGQA